MLACLAMLLLIIGITEKSGAQSILAAGDLVFTSFDATPNVTAVSPDPVDRFSFVLLAPISSGTRIYFTDRGYASGAWLSSNASSEGVMSWTSTTAIPSGTEVVISLGGGTLATINGVQNGTTAYVSGRPGSGMSLGNFGDQIIAFQSGNGEPAGGTTIAGIHFSQCGSTTTTNTTVANWDATCSGPSNSQMPPGLVGGISAFWLGFSGNYNDFYRQGSFNSATVISPKTPANIRAAVMNVNNWTRSISNTPGDVPVPSGADFSSCTAPAVSGNPPNRTICANTGTTFPITATGTGLTYQWQEGTSGNYSNISNGGIFSGATTSTLSLSSVPGSKSGYSYRCVVTGTCGTATTNVATLTVLAVAGTISNTNLSCFGASNATATVTATGGIPPYTYAWSPSGGTAATASGLSAGTYTVTILDNLGCQGSASVTITQPSVGISGTTVVTNVACNGGTNGSIDLTPTGGVAPYTYNWGGGITFQDRVAIAAGTYSVTIRDANGCTGTLSGIIVTQPAQLNGSTVVTNVLCNGGTTGAINLTPTGGTAPYTFDWGAGVTTEDRTGLAAGSYSVTITDAKGCARVVNATVVQPATLTASQGNVNNVSCNGGSNGSATVNVSGGTVPYTYDWNGTPTGDGTATISGLASGVYSVTVTDANGCTAVQSFTVAQPAVLSATASQTNITCGGSATGSAGVTVSGGTAPYSYQWSPSGGTGATATGLVAGTYTVTVRDANLCQLTQSFTITQPSALVATAGSQTNIGCRGEATGSATVNVSGGTGAYTYSWAPSGGTAATASGLAAGTYVVTVRDANLCVATQSFTLTQPATLLSATTASTGVSCFGGSNGSASVTVTGGTPGYTYLWAPLGGTSASITGRPAGNYTCTITDANGCTLVRNVTIGTPAALSVSTVVQTDVSCNGGTNGSATVSATGGTGGYTYSWSPRGGTNATATGLSAGTYTVTVRDANTCTVNHTVVIGQPATLSANSSKTDVLCNGGATGTASVSVSGGTAGYTYIWSPSGGTAATATGLAAGNYSVLVTDARGCSITRSFTVNQPAALTATTAQQNATCIAPGQASVTPSGGAGSYTYLWSPSGATTQLATGLAAGSHSCLITDANGCSITKNFTITTTNTLVAAQSQTNVLCNGANTGTATVVPSGAPGPYTYAWAPSGGNAATASNLSAGNYSVTITSSNGCSTVKNFTITEPSALTAFPSQTNLACQGGSNGSASVAVAGGTGAYTYLWSPSGGTAATATGLTAGNYTVTVKDANFCQVTRNFVITAPSALVASVGAKVDVACNGASTGSATVNVTGGTGAYAYSWSPSGGTAASASGLSAGTYMVTIRDANLCQTTQSITISEPAVVALSATAPASGNVGAAYSNAFTATGGSGIFGYTVSAGALPTGLVLGTDGVVSGTPTTAGTFSFTIRATENGCSRSATRAYALSVVAGSQTIAFGALDAKTFGEIPFALNGSSTSGLAVAYSSSNTAVATVNGSTVTIIGAGSTTITASQTGNGNYDAAGSVAQTLVVNKATASISLSGLSQNYDGTPKAAVAATVPAGLAGVSITYNGSVAVPSDAGNYAVVASLTNANYSAANATGTMVIGTQGQVVVFAPLASSTYGDPAITLAAGGGASGNAINYTSSNTEVATLNGSTLTIIGAGTATITASQAGSANYGAATPVSRTLSVSPKQVTGTFTVSNKSYDGNTSAQIVSRSLTGVLASDLAEVNLTGGSASFADANVGLAKGVTPAGMTLAGSRATNYTLMGTSGATADIVPKAITVTADAKTKTYGEIDPALTFSVPSGSLVGSDAITGTLSRTAGNLAGSYPINIGTLSAGRNYSITFVAANLTIVPKLLTVTADSKSRAFNTANPVLTVSYSGFAGTENASVLMTQPGISTTATMASPAGNYPITASGASASNYTFSYVNGTLTVTSTTQTITFAALADRLSTDAPFALGATASSGLPVTYASSDATVARIIGGNQLEILRAGTVTITASQPGNANYSAAAPVLRQLRIIENPAPVIAITSSRGASISKGETSVLTATGAVAYVWATAAGIVSGQNSASLSVRPSVSTTYTVTGTNQFGRSSTASFRLEVRSDFQALKATNVMTPNGDGVNDVWVVENIDLYPENQVTIIDRAGRAVLKVKGYQNNWDATLNGLPLDQGTYYYIIDFGKGFGLQKGFISVVRGK